MFTNTQVSNVLDTQQNYIHQGQEILNTIILQKF